MKAVLLNFFLISLCFDAVAQTNPLPGNTYGLIYDSLDLQKIIPQVDSLNSSFNLRKPTKHYGTKQARANYIFLPGPHKDALNDIKHKLPFEQFIIKYPNTQFTKDVLVIQESHLSYDKMPMMRFSVADPLNEQFASIYYKDLKLLPSDYNNNVIYNEYNFKDGGIYAFYFLEDFSSPELPETYSRMIDYKETIFDSSETKFSPNTEKRFYSLFHKPSNTIDSFIVPAHYGSDVLILTKNMNNTPGNIKSLYYRKVDSAISNYYLKGTFEYVIRNMALSDTTLSVEGVSTLKYNCENKDGPDIRNYNFANLALKSGDLKLFLNAHRSVMTGQRNYFGIIIRKNYPNQRDFFADELDFIHVDMGKYFIGSYLSPKNNTHHTDYSYARLNHFEMYSFIDKDHIEKLILQAISDKDLDNFSRLSFAQLFAKYCRDEADEVKQNNNIERLNTVLKDLPGCIKFSYAAFVEKNPLLTVSLFLSGSDFEE